MLIKGQLEEGQVHNVSADPTNLPEGLIFLNYTSGLLKIVMGGAARVLASVTGAITVSGSLASPNAITAVGGIAFTSTSMLNTTYITGSAGAIDVTANPQIAVGTIVGQRLRIIPCHATNTVTLEHGTGLDLNGTWVGGTNEALELEWNGSAWFEVGRR